MATAPRRTWSRIAAIVAVIVVAHVVIVTWFVLGSSDRTKTIASASSAPPVVPSDQLPIAATTIDPPTAAAPPTVASARVIASPDAASSVTPEPIEELSAFFRKPPGADEWTPDQRRAYLQKLLDDLDDKERSLERELRTAERSGDKAKAEEKRATLAHLRDRKLDIVASVRSRLDASL